jgi:hypothetical protein
LALVASGTSRTYRKGELEGSPSSFTRDGRELTILIPDVDSKLRSGSVKHKSIKIVKKRSKRVHAIARACAIAVRDRGVTRARVRVYMLVRSCCFSPWRSMASSMRRSINCG